MTSASAFDELARTFRWALPARLNMGVEVSDRWAAIDPDRPAIISHGPDTVARVTDFGTLSALSNRLANVLLGLGLVEGDRVAILLPQALAAALAHIAAYKAGMVALPLSMLFGHRRARVPAEARRRPHRRDHGCWRGQDRAAPRPSCRTSPR
jgi:acetyl-CoA synthetase